MTSQKKASAAGVRGWRSRIVGQGTENPDQLLANPLNWRIHPRHQQEALQGVLDEVGWVQQVIVNKRTGHVVDGHLRVALALRREEPEVPVLYVDLSEDEERLILATLDPIAALAVVDREKLADVLAQLPSQRDSVSDLLKSIAVNEGLQVQAVGFPDLREGDKPPWRQITFTLSEDQAQVVDAAVSRSLRSGHGRSASNDNKNGNALFAICQQWLENAEEHQSE